MNALTRSVWSLGYSGLALTSRSGVALKKTSLVKSFPLTVAFSYPARSLSSRRIHRASSHLAFIFPQHTTSRPYSSIQKFDPKAPSQSKTSSNALQSGRTKVLKSDADFNLEATIVACNIFYKFPPSLGVTTLYTKDFGPLEKVIYESREFSRESSNKQRLVECQLPNSEASINQIFVTLPVDIKIALFSAIAKQINRGYCQAGECRGCESSKTLKEVQQQGFENALRRLGPFYVPHFKNIVHHLASHQAIFQNRSCADKVEGYYINTKQLSNNSKSADGFATILTFHKNASRPTEEEYSGKAPTFFQKITQKVKATFSLPPPLTPYQRLGVEEGASSWCILGLQKGANQQEIRKAYLDLIKKWHPDKVSEHEKKYAQDVFNVIETAYKDLRDQYYNNDDL